jgi:hypothetical protein
VADADTTPHAGHDPLLVAALVDRDLSGPEHDRARALVADCRACAELHADLLSLASATATLPTAPRPRDFTLSPADVERLRPNLVRRLLGAIGTSRDSFSRPLAMGLTTLGLAGLLVATVPTVLPSGGGATLSTVGAGVDTESNEFNALSAAPGASAERSSVSAAPAPAQAPDPPEAAGGGLENPVEQPDEAERDVAGDTTFGTDGDAPLLAPDPSGVSSLVVVSGSLLIIGLGLFALRWSSRRFGG